MFGLDLMIFLAIVIAGYMAWNIGANDVANAMGTSVGSKALTLRNAIIIAAVFEFLGAFFAGDAVTDTVRKGVLVISEEEMEMLSTELYYGFIAAMLAAALWITFATRYGLPVSTTHSIPVPQPAAPSTMTITVPPGVVSGQVLTVTMPNGQVVNVEVPPGCSSGSQFTITVKQ